MEIVQLAGVAKGSFYNNFSTKSDLFDEILRRMMTALNEHVQKSVEGIDDPLQRVTTGIRCGVRTLLADRDSCRILIHAGPTKAGGGISDQVLRNDSLAAIAAGVETKVFRQRDPRLLYAAYFGVLHSSIEELFKQSERRSPEEEAEIVVELALAVLGVPVTPAQNV